MGGDYLRGDSRRGCRYFVDDKKPAPVAKTESEPPLVVQSATSQEPVPSLSLSDGSVQVARVEDLAKPWSAKKFTFVKPFNHQSVDAMAIRLPGGALWGFALQEPYGPCELEYVTDLARLAKQYGYQASHPMVGNPCNKTIYDPTKLGSLGEGVWTRGEIVQGGGIRPPIAIDVDVKDGFIIADRIE